MRLPTILVASYQYKVSTELVTCKLYTKLLEKYKEIVQTAPDSCMAACMPLVEFGWFSTVPIIWGSDMFFISIISW